MNIFHRIANALVFVLMLSSIGLVQAKEDDSIGKELFVALGSALVDGIGADDRPCGLLVVNLEQGWGIKTVTVNNGSVQNAFRFEQEPNRSMTIS